MAQVAGRTPVVGMTTAVPSSSAQEQQSQPRQQEQDSYQNNVKKLPNLPSTLDRPPTPPPKDSPSTPRTPMPDREPSSTMTTSTDFTSYFRPARMSRTASVYSLSRISFSSQISQLTDIPLPDTASLKSSISAIATSAAASKALTEAADQIQMWIQKASDVLGGLDARDDAEWAAAAGHDGLAEVDLAISRFEGLIEVYVAAVEELQLRSDSNSVSTADLKSMVTKVEKVTTDWQRVKKSLDQIKRQVKLAMDWANLENGLLEEIGTEIESLSRLIFEMEERRYQSSNEFWLVQDHGLDLDELETAVHEGPWKATETPMLKDKFNLSGTQPSPAAAESPGLPNVMEDSTLLGLFARMEPLKANLDFLPMNLSTFRDRAEDVFPTACDLLDERKQTFDSQWKKLEADAEYLRRELGEDRWNLVFRSAGKQALKLIDSVERSLTKVDESLGNDTNLKHSPSTLKKIENYQAKKIHYCPAIDRVLSIVERGVKDRLTMNGEIINLRADLRQKWQTLQKSMRSMDSLLEEYATGHPAKEQLRDSISSIVTNDRSLEDSAQQTPGSSPPSSVVSARSRKGSSTETPSLLLRLRSRLPNTNAPANSPGSSPPSNPTVITSTPGHLIGENKRHMSLPAAANHTSVTRSSAFGPAQAASPTHAAKPISRRPAPNTPTQTPRPRWNFSKNSRGDYDVSEFYASLRAKSAALTRKAPPQGIASTPDVKTPVSVRSTSARPPLSRKASDLSQSQRSTSRPPHLRLPPSRDNSPFGARSRSDGQAPGRSVNAHPPMPLAGGATGGSSPPQLHSPELLQSHSPATADGTAETPSAGSAAQRFKGRRRASMIPVPARPASAMRVWHADGGG